MLKIGVKENQALAHCARHARGHRGFLAEVASKVDRLDSMIAVSQCVEIRLGSIRRSVVDDENLVGDPDIAQDAVQPVDQAGQDRRLVEGGNNHGHLGDVVVHREYV